MFHSYNCWDVYCNTKERAIISRGWYLVLQPDSHCLQC